jgi:hypothetical protein
VGFASGAVSFDPLRGRSGKNLGGSQRGRSTLEACTPKEMSKVKIVAERWLRVASSLGGSFDPPHHSSSNLQGTAMLKQSRTKRVSCPCSGTPRPSRACRSRAPRDVVVVGLRGGPRPALETPQGRTLPKDDPAITFAPTRSFLATVVEGNRVDGERDDSKVMEVPVCRTGALPSSLPDHSTKVSGGMLLVVSGGEFRVAVTAVVRL